MILSAKIDRAYLVWPRSSWAQYLAMYGVTDMGFPHEKAKGKRPPVKKDKMPYGKGPKKD